MYQALVTPMGNLILSEEGMGVGSRREEMGGGEGGGVVVDM